MHYINGSVVPKVVKLNSSIRLSIGFLKKNGDVRRGGPQVQTIGFPAQKVSTHTSLYPYRHRTARIGCDQALLGFPTSWKGWGRWSPWGTS